MKNRLLTLSGALALLAWMSPVRGDTIESFVIQNSSDPSVPGGTLFGGGTYSGSFSLDESLIPANPDARFALETFNVSFSIPLDNIDENISPANGGSANFSTLTLNNIPHSNLDLAIDTIEFNGPDLSDLVLELVEPAGVFQGGLVDFASADDLIFGVHSFDVSGTALVIDPAVVPTPEPNCGLLLAGGVCLFAGIRRKRWPKLSPTAGESRD